ncbi:MAG: hypothetical protein ACE14P_14355 [Methanotrichaceae archaeon]
MESFTPKGIKDAKNACSNDPTDPRNAEAKIPEFKVSVCKIAGGD